MEENHIARNHDIDTVTIHCVVGQCAVATFDEVYTTVYRGNSNGQIIHTAEGTFASMTGNNSYAQFYIKCPDE